MLLLATESLDAAGPVLAVHALDGLAAKIGLDWSELSVRVVICRARHVLPVRRVVCD
jgi:hypothetical protein